MACCFQCGSPDFPQGELIFCAGNCGNVRHKKCKGNRSPSKGKFDSCNLCQHLEEDSLEKCLARTRFLVDQHRMLQLQLHIECESAKELNRRIHAAERTIAKLEKQVQTPSPKRKRSKSASTRGLAPKPADPNTGLPTPTLPTVSVEGTRQEQHVPISGIATSDSMEVDDGAVETPEATQKPKKEKPKKLVAAKATEEKTGDGVHQPSNSAASETRGKTTTQLLKQPAKKSAAIKGTAENDELSLALMPTDKSNRRKKGKRRPPAIFLYGLNDKASVTDVLQWFTSKGNKPKKVSKLKVARNGSSFCVSFNPSDIEKCLEPSYYPKFMRVKKWRGPFPKSEQVEEAAPSK